MLKATVLGLAGALIVGCQLSVTQPANADHWQDQFDQFETDRWRDWNRFNNINQKQWVLLDQMKQARSSGKLTVGEYRKLLKEFRAISLLEMNYNVNGLNLAEHQDLTLRLNNLERAVRQNAYNGHYAGRSFVRWY